MSRKAFMQAEMNNHALQLAIKIMMVAPANDRSPLIPKTMATREQTNM